MMNSTPLPEADVLPLIISQLIAYGYSAIAQTVADATGTSCDMLPSSKLSELLGLGKERHQEDSDTDMPEKQTGGNDIVTNDSTRSHTGFDPEAIHSQPKTPVAYTQLYYTQHKGPCRTAIFSKDGRFAATGSFDASLKLLDVNKMKKRTGGASDKPVIRTLYDHTAPVNDIDFHPNGLVLASCADDQSIKLFDLSKSNVKRAFRYLQDTQPVHSIQFHPSGDFLLAGTQDPQIRIYDVNTLQCYTNRQHTERHQAAISQIRYAPETGRMFASSSVDGTVKIWDGVSGQCIKSLEKVHGGLAVSSVRITKNEKYILTAGMDSSLRLWDISSGKLMMEYKGHEQRSQMLQPDFSYNEDFVMIGDEATTDVVVYDTQTGVLVKRITGQNNLVRCVATSPIDEGVLSCSDDYRARYYGSTNDITI
ncbi:WD40-repeat-containing domain protein [Halteromyces radiatus]|uniref:WD40-repeat-containing domain protein n=1 Tax=Halteromyces radiatus TaxID=101107 RepID=UPI00221E99C9|nr:WD40-repeat-containing domain protein [Halteromyces radiatus]KAI8099577.1 WD40-repeat-containing domain protein [Halteromyces radiatus]